jgi:hypothetical protein
MQTYIEPQLQPSPDGYGGTTWTLALTITAGRRHSWTSSCKLAAKDWDAAQAEASSQVLAMAKTLGAEIHTGQKPNRRDSSSR